TLQRSFSSLAGAGVVSTWVISCGASSSQVWVKCTLYPTHSVVLFAALAGIQVIGRVDELSRRQGWLLPPLSSLFPCFKLLLPNGAQGGDGRQRFHPVRGVRSLERIKQRPAIGSHVIGVLLALLLLLGQAFVFEPFSIALHPLDWHMGENPIRGDLREHVQDIDHGLSNTQGAIEGADL